MIQKTFITNPSNAINKIAELRKEGWTIIATANTSTLSTEPDAHGVSYGGSQVSILAERKYTPPQIFASTRFGELPMSRPCNPPGPARY